MKTGRLRKIHRKIVKGKIKKDPYRIEFYCKPEFTCDYEKAVETLEERVRIFEHKHPMFKTLGKS